MQLTVKQFIEQLQKFDPQAIVTFSVNDTLVHHYEQRCFCNDVVDMFGDHSEITVVLTGESNFIV